jgi:hypothetical protein
MTHYCVVIARMQTFVEVRDIDASSVQQARSQVGAESDSLEFKERAESVLSLCVHHSRTGGNATFKRIIDTTIAARSSSLA